MIRQRGFTLVELMVVISVTAILLMVTVPSFVQMFARVRVEGTGNELAADLQYARSESVRRRTDVSLTPTPAGTGYLVESGGQALKTVQFADGIEIAADPAPVAPDKAVVFSAMRAMSTKVVAFNLKNTAGTAQLRVSTNVMGRVQMCSPGNKINSYPAC